MTSLGEEAAAGLRTALGERERVAALLGQSVGAQPAQQHIVGSRVLGVQLQPIALEPLHLQGLALDRVLLLRCDRQAEYRQAAVLLPELADAPIDAEAGLAEAALDGLRLSTAGRRQRQ